MMILPAQIALTHGTEGQLGVLEKADTDKPEFVVETVEVSVCNARSFHFCLMSLVMIFESYFMYSHIF